MPRTAAAHRRAIGARRASLAGLAVLAIGAAAGCSEDPTPGTDLTEPTQTTSTTTASPPSTTPPASSTTRTPTPSRTTATPTRTITAAENLDVPWDLAFLPDGSALVTLRDRAELLQVREGSPPRRLGQVPGVVPGGEGGLLGVAVSPDYAQDRQVFLYLTAAEDNRVVSLTFAGGRAGSPRPVLTGIPKAGNHNGGRIAFGPDGHLYVATGDAGERTSAQDRDSLGGKILRITKDGDPAPGNPFPGSPVWSLGHRNVQGLAWDEGGAMYASEFGQNTWDEVNVIRRGANYGWPEVEGRGGDDRFVDPLRQWTTDEASPSGIAISEDGTLYMAALRGESLWRMSASGGRVGEPQRLLAGDYGRLRDVKVGPDGRLWVLTNNTSRGEPAANDDRLLIIPPSRL